MNNQELILRIETILAETDWFQDLLIDIQKKVNRLQNKILKLKQLQDIQEQQSLDQISNQTPSQRMSTNIKQILSSQRDIDDKDSLQSDSIQRESLKRESSKRNKKNKNDIDKKLAKLTKNYGNHEISKEQLYKKQKKNSQGSSSFIQNKNKVQILQNLSMIQNESQLQEIENKRIIDDLIQQLQEHKEQQQIYIEQIEDKEFEIEEFKKNINQQQNQLDNYDIIWNRSIQKINNIINDENGNNILNQYQDLPQLLDLIQVKQNTLIDEIELLNTNQNINKEINYSESSDIISQEIIQSQDYAIQSVKKLIKSIQQKIQKNNDIINNLSGIQREQYNSIEQNNLSETYKADQLQMNFEIQNIKKLNEQILNLSEELQTFLLDFIQQQNKDLCNQDIQQLQERLKFAEELLRRFQDKFMEVNEKFNKEKDIEQRSQSVDGFYFNLNIFNDEQDLNESEIRYRTQLTNKIQENKNNIQVDDIQNILNKNIKQQNKIQLLQDMVNQQQDIQDEQNIQQDSLQLSNNQLKTYKTQSNASLRNNMIDKENKVSQKDNNIIK